MGSASAPVSTDPIYVLAVGNDSRYKTAEDSGVGKDDPSYSDTIMLMRLDPEKNYISILSIPRDTAAEYNGEPVKINAVHQMGGIQALTKYVEGMFGIDIPYYFDLKFVDFANLVDKLGGVGVNVPMGLTGGDIINGGKISLEAGDNTLDGASALMLARQRKVYSGNGEAIRQMISRDLVANAIQAVAAASSSEAGNYADILKSFGESNMPENVLTAYVAAYMDNDGKVAFNLGTTPYDGGIDDTGSWRVAADPEIYAAEKASMETGDPALTDIVALPDVS